MSSDRKPPSEATARGGIFSRFRRRKVDLDAPAEVVPETDTPSAEGAVAVQPETPAVRVEEQATVPDTAVTRSEPEPEPEPEPDNETAPIPRAATAEPARRGLFRRALARTGAGLGSLLLGRKAIDDELYEELETQLLLADVGVEVCATLIEELTARVKRRDLKDAAALREELRALLIEMLIPCQQPLDLGSGGPRVVLVIGVNGVGKTTTIGKLAHRFQAQGKRLVLAAGDTFRAAAVEQLQVWGERNGVPVVAQSTGADSASVIFDAIQSARARGLDLVIADTAGRLHTKDNLMAELAKVRRVMAKLDPQAPHETLLVLDAGTGQNAVVQMRQFSASVPVTGIALTKLDGTAKGGVIFALCREFGVPIRFVGLGEGLGDLQEFDAELFVDALLAAPEA